MRRVVAWSYVSVVTVAAVVVFVADAVLLLPLLTLTADLSGRSLRPLRLRLAILVPPSLPH
jgi:hypothetical protein